MSHVLVNRLARPSRGQPGPPTILAKSPKSKRDAPNFSAKACTDRIGDSGNSTVPVANTPRDPSSIHQEISDYGITGLIGVERLYNSPITDRPDCSDSHTGCTRYQTPPFPKIGKKVTTDDNKDSEHDKTWQISHSYAPKYLQKIRTYRYDNKNKQPQRLNEGPCSV